jgi:hypothetical protein
VDVAENAIRNRSVSHIGIFGWSHGGGATYDLAETLTNLKTGAIGDLPDTFTIDATAYIDAVNYGSLQLAPGVGFPGTESWVPMAEFRRPPGAEKVANWYQEAFEPFAGTHLFSPRPADLEQNLTNLIAPADRRHVRIVDVVSDMEVLYDYFEDEMEAR